MIDLGRYAGDPAFTATTFIIVDFEGSTPAGRPAEPIEIGAVVVRATTVGLRELGRFDALIRPPRHAPVTDVGTQQNGITAAMVADQQPAALVLAGFDATLTAPPYTMVAHHAPTEAGIIGRYAHACPRLASAPMLDTLRLARHAYPALTSYTLDALLTHLKIPIPVARHRALPDAVATKCLFARLLTDGSSRHRWSRLNQLHGLGGLDPPAAAHAQSPLF